MAIENKTNYKLDKKITWNEESKRKHVKKMKSYWSEKEEK